MNDLKGLFIWEDVTHLWYRSDRKVHTADTCRYCSESHRKVAVETLNPEGTELCVTCVENYSFGPKRSSDGYRKAELLEWIDRFVRVFGVVPTSRDFRTSIGPYPQVYERHFGSFTNAIEEAGY